MTYKMVVSDFDGTLCHSDDTVSERCKKAIQDYRDKGGIFAVSTGRMHKAIAERIKAEGIGGSFPLMCFQGSLIRNSLSGETLYKTFLPLPLVIEIVSECVKMGLYTHIYDFDEIYVPELNELNKVYLGINRVSAKVVGDLSAYLRHFKGEVPKVLCIVDEGKIQEVQKILNEKFGKHCQVLISAPRLLEFFSFRAGKGNALKFAANYYGIDLAHTIAIGDEMNDASMIQLAGLGIAMGNAAAKLKQMANFVTGTNDEDGVAQVLEQYCLK